MSSLFESINSWEFKPYRRMGVTIDEEMFYAKILARFVEGLGPRKVLDVGCGNCLFSLVLKKMFPTSRSPLLTYGTMRFPSLR